MTDNSWRIKSISVEGLLGARDLKWDLRPSVNILGGPNGSGKSTLLHAVAMILQAAPQESVDKKKLMLHFEALFGEMNISMESDASFEVRREVVIDKDRDASVLSSTSDMDEPESVKVNFIAKNVLPEKDGKSGNVKDYLPSNVIYISSDHPISTIANLLERSKHHNILPTITSLDLLLEDSLNTRNQLFTQRMTMAMQAEDEDLILKLRRLFGRFEASVKSFMEDYVIIDTSTLTFAKSTDIDSKINYNRLSTGQKQLLYILLTVCNTLGEPTILLLDEADLGMHIDWKEKLLRELININPNMQILVATHSPSLTAGWYDSVKEISQLYVE